MHLSIRSISTESVEQMSCLSFIEVNDKITCYRNIKQIKSSTNERENFSSRYNRASATEKLVVRLTLI